MDPLPASRREGEDSRNISSVPDFAEIFVFLQSLGPYMKFPEINLVDLEDFFGRGNYYVTS